MKTSVKREDTSKKRKANAKTSRVDKIKKWQGQYIEMKKFLNENIYKSYITKCG